MLLEAGGDFPAAFHGAHISLEIQGFPRQSLKTFQGLLPPFRIPAHQPDGGSILDQHPGSGQADAGSPSADHTPFVLHSISDHIFLSFAYWGQHNKKGDTVSTISPLS